MKKLIRKGKCQRCGNCCVANAPHGCQQCGTLADGRTYCKIYENRPEVCKNFPNHPRCTSQHSECGFKFYDAETGVEITKKKRRNAEGNWECDWGELDSYAPVNERC